MEHEANVYWIDYFRGNFPNVLILTIPIKITRKEGKGNMIKIKINLFSVWGGNRFLFSNFYTQMFQFQCNYDSHQLDLHFRQANTKSFLQDIEILAGFFCSPLTLEKTWQKKQLKWTIPILRLKNEPAQDQLRTRLDEKENEQTKSR